MSEMKDIYKAFPEVLSQENPGVLDQWLLEVVFNLNYYMILWQKCCCDVQCQPLMESWSRTWSHMRRSLGLTPKFIGFCKCNSRGTWNKECALFPGVCDFPVAVSTVCEFTAQTQLLDDLELQLLIWSLLKFLKDSYQVKKGIVNKKAF